MVMKIVSNPYNDGSANANFYQVEAYSGYWNPYLHLNFRVCVGRQANGMCINFAAFNNKPDTRL